MGEITKILTNIREGDKRQFVDLLERFEPLIKKYVKYLYKDDAEDVRAELSCALWEAVLKMGYIEQEGQIVNYLQRALFNRYLELYRGSRKKHDHEMEAEDSNLMSVQVIENEFEEVIINELVNKILSQYSGKKKIVYRLMLVNELTDTEIAAKYGMSRQYVNRLRRELKSDFEKGYSR